MTDSPSSSSEIEPSGAVSQAAPVASRSALRAARDRKGVHLVVLAGKLKVPVARLQALEEGRFEEFGDPVFVRTLALSVCRQLEVDPAEVLAELPAGSDHPLEKIGQGLQTPFREHSGHAFLDTQSLRVRVAMAAAVVGVSVLVVWGVWVDFFKSSPEVATAGATGASGASGAPLAMSAASASEMAGSAVSAASVETVYAGGPVDAATGVVVTANEDSWVEVLDARGDVVVSKVVQPGESLKISAALPLRLKVGNAKATQILFNGRAIDLSGSTRDNIARVDLN